MSLRGDKSSKDAATLCWSCARALGGCPWTERDKKTHQVRFAPVEGWEAEKTVINGSKSRRGERRYAYATDSYRVKKRPLYQRDRRTAARSIMPAFAIAAKKQKRQLTDGTGQLPRKQPHERSFPCNHYSTRRQGNTRENETK